MENCRGNDVSFFNYDAYMDERYATEKSYLEPINGLYNYANTEEVSGVCIKERPMQYRARFIKKWLTQLGY